MTDEIVNEVLWIVSASSKTCSEITHVYAVDEHAAREQARAWLAERPHLPMHAFRAFPGGFQFCQTRMPGSQESISAHP